jgi:DNA-binding transcriptional LysR family regulator
MSRYHTPPIHLLRAFTMTARAGTVSAAAEALHLTQSAVSKQVQDLEDWLGVALFERVKKRLRLTPAGHRYLQAVNPLLQQLDAITIDLMSNPLGDAVLHLSCLPTFAAKWLVPRLPAFQAAHPKITLHFVPFVDGYDFLRSDLDCAVRYGHGTWPGAQAVYVTGREMVLIAPPRQAASAALRKPDDIRHFALLQHQTVPEAWEGWCRQYEVSGVKPGLGPQFDQYQTLIRAVAAGMGLGLVPSCLVQQEVEHGEVRLPLQRCGYRSTTGYFLCYPEVRAEMPALVVFKDWLAQQAGACRTECPGATPAGPAAASRGTASR